MITPEMIVQRARAMLPDGVQYQGTLRQRAGLEQFTDTPFNARQKARYVEMVGAGNGRYARSAGTVQLFMEGQAAPPTVGDKWLDAAAVTWEITRVDSNQFRNIFDLSLLQDVLQTSPRGTMLSSQFEAILNALQPVVATNTPGVTVEIRKDEILWPKDLVELPKVLIAPGWDRDVQWAFGNTVNRDYQVFVVFVWAGNQTYEGPFGDVPQLKQDVKRALDTQALAGVDEVWATRCPGGRPLFDRAGLEANFEIDVLEIVYTTSEVGHT